MTRSLKAISTVLASRYVKPCPDQALRTRARRHLSMSLRLGAYSSFVVRMISGGCKPRQVVSILKQKSMLTRTVADLYDTCGMQSSFLESSSCVQLACLLQSYRVGWKGPHRSRVDECLWLFCLILLRILVTKLEVGLKEYTESVCESFSCPAVSGNPRIDVLSSCQPMTVHLPLVLYSTSVLA